MLKPNINIQEMLAGYEMEAFQFPETTQKLL